ncbi:hypothetical protein POTOM_035267 [Populus tomentosa]|uniref:Uncharacterized protein n=1 Tax=Populus tomentosa TaxID=118781 RepID=A0A8X7YY88_POPTO|nr:hypothetical protein POTOM_035267 [Populus tomentosa]
MARQADRLVKIGQEGFAAIDEHFGRARWRRPPVMKVPYAHPTYYYVPATEVIDSNEAANAIRGGFMSITLRGNHSLTKLIVDEESRKSMIVDRLTRIGMEGFALIENSYGWPGRSGRLPSTQGTQITTVRMPVIIRNEVVQYYGNMVKKPCKFYL